MAHKLQHFQLLIPPGVLDGVEVKEAEEGVVDGRAGNKLANEPGNITRRAIAETSVFQCKGHRAQNIVEGRDEVRQTHAQQNSLLNISSFLLIAQNLVHYPATPKHGQRSRDTGQRRESHGLLFVHVAGRLCF